MKRKLLLIALISFLASVIVYGENAVENNGEDKRFSLFIEECRQQVLVTIKRPDVWVPLIGMAVFLAGDFDDDVSDWASNENPLFGSRTSAKDFSDIGRNTLVAGGLLSSLFKINNKKGCPLAFDYKGAVNGGKGLASTYAATQFFKTVIGRERPDAHLGGESPNRSFPSGHASISFWGASVIKHKFGQLDYFREHEKMKKVFGASMYGLASAVAWGRVEGKRHWPSDVLFGTAIGDFFGNVFFKSKNGHQSGFMVTPFNDGLAFRFHSRF